MTVDQPRQLHLNLFIIGVGHAEGSWRLPTTHPERIRDLDFYTELAALAEKGRFDAIFLSDNPSLLESSQYGPRQPLEPLTLLSALAAVTSRIGLIGSASTTFNEPFNLARQFASLDHISRGRAAWNIVTTSSPPAARNFGLDGPPDHDWRYRRAVEFVEVATKLWDSWETGAEIFDRSSGNYLDMQRVREIRHQGPEFTVRGPMSIQRPPQGRPVFFQAGASPAGRDFAARFAEAMFIAPPTLEESRTLYADIKARAAGYGRRASQILAFPSITPILGGTEEEALRIEADLHEMTSIDATIQIINNFTAGIDLSQFPLDGPFPDLGRMEQFNGTQSATQYMIDLARRENLTVRGVIEFYRNRRNGATFVGTPEQLVDHMQEWFLTGGADGFMIGPPELPDSLVGFIENVVPELQRRGLYRTEYEGSTLRDHFGLDVPANQYDEARPAAVAAPAL